MRHFLVALGLAAALATPGAADPVEGLWQTRPDDDGNFGHVRITPCGAKLCGTLVTAFGPDRKPVESDTVGKRIVWDMEPLGDGRYGNGKVWAPDRDKTYNSKMELEGNRLAVSGCVLGICRDGGKWLRVK
ncbi:putative membrane protein [Rhodovulum sp. P5]|uniref:DUF2147 domain-containing protein n=1 Tax=Rhodovulum sp. P5 TaxID=1564506 RepID=UPI0009C31C0F|nr:DUF2147 domain-containing protein [Rhodovulum sp. P5]ARE41908.1 putative membrane protein [Rhodovulum sp. P5]